MTELSAPPLTLLDKYEGDEVLPLYTARVTLDGGVASHGRASGKVTSDDGALELDLRLPKELGGPGGGPNPEQLFAAGYAACYHGALMLIAAKNKIPVQDVSIDATATFARDPQDGTYLLTATLEVSLLGVEAAQAEQLIAETEKICPYAKMARQGIRHSVSVA